MPFDDRTRIVAGADGMERLAGATVSVYGLGGVGATAAMDLVRAGVGRLLVADFDTISETNLNRLYFGYSDTIGRTKASVLAEFARRVNPLVVIEEVGTFVSGAGAAKLIYDDSDYHLDCIDTLNAKVNLMAALARAGMNFSSAMGTAGRMAPERLRIGSLWDATGCPLAADTRKRLRRLGFGPPGQSLAEAGQIGVSMPSAFLCVWSDEPPVPPELPSDGTIPGTVRDGARVRAVQGSTPFVPQTAGHILASVAVRHLLGWRGGRPA